MRADPAGPIIQVTQAELSYLMRNAKPHIVHTWGMVNGGILWRKCPWTVPMICDLRGIEMPDEVRAGFMARVPEK